MYLSSTLCWDNGVDEVIALAAHLGFSGVEVWAEQVWQHGTDESSIAAARARYQQELTLHAASWDLNLCALNESVRQQSLREIERSMDLARRIGAPNVTVHPGHYTLPQLSELQWTWLIESLTRLANCAEQLQVTLSIEMMEPTAKEFVTTPEMVNQLLSALPPSVTTTFDVAHVPLKVNCLASFKRLNRVSKIHFSDSSSERYHVPLGKGALPMDVLFPFLQTVDVPVVLEGFDLSATHEILQQDLEFIKQMGTAARGMLL